MGRWRYFILSAVTVAVAAAGLSGGYARLCVSRLFIAAIAALGSYVIVNQSGRLCMCGAAFMSIGAYASALSPSLPISLVLSLTLPAALAVILSLVGRRLGGDAFALVSYGTGEIVRVVIENSERLGSAAGLYGIDTFCTPPLAAALFLLSFFLVSAFRRSPLGLKTRAVRDSCYAAEACGIDCGRIRTAALCFGAAVIGLSGLLYCGLLGFISPADFSFLKSMDMIAAVVLGSGSPVITAVVAAAIEGQSLLLQSLSQWRMIIYAVVLIALPVLSDTAFINSLKKRGGKRPAFINSRS